MNSFILMAEVIQSPQLRYTSDNQTPIAEMLVQFEGLRQDDPPATLKVVGWGNLAQEIQENYHEGDRVIVEGRLNMNTIDRPEGFKEKRAELTAQRIHHLSGSDGSIRSSVAESRPSSAPASQSSAQSGDAPAAKSKPSSKPAAKASAAQASSAPNYASPGSESADYDDIPF